MSSFNRHGVRKYGYSRISILQANAKSAFDNHTYLAIAIPLLLCYLGLARYLRYRNVNRLKQKYGFTANKESYKDMTVEQAQEIERNMAEWDFPAIFEFGWIVEFLKVGGTASTHPVTPLQSSSHMPSLIHTVIFLPHLIMHIYLFFRFLASSIHSTRDQTNLNYA